MRKLIKLSVRYPKITIWISVLITFAFLSQIPKIKIDTDPENMLSQKEWVRRYHNQVKKTFSIEDLIVVGITNYDNPHGVFNKESLNRIATATNQILDIKGVVIRDVISPTTVDDIQERGGMLSIDRLQKGMIEDPQQAFIIQKRTLANPLFKDKLISHDGKDLCLYIPIESKDQCYRISNEIKSIMNDILKTEKYFISGLPVAEDTFGIEMFKQMGLSSPISALLVLLLIYLFIRKFSLSIAAMMVAFFSIIWTMGLLIGMGYTVHIMSSMIPIFLIPISVDDSVHVLSHFSEVYQKHKDKEVAIIKVIDDLWSPMLYTTLTTMAGFASLALTPIPPVQVFGLFICFGKFVAWILTMTLIPAFAVLLNEKKLHNFGREEESHTPLTRFLNRLATFSITRQKVVLPIALAFILLSTYGLTRIVVNDNPVKWFSKNHPIRIADRIINKNFGGTYMAYLVFEGSKEGAMKNPDVMNYIEKMQRQIESSPIVGKTSSVVDIIKKLSYEIHNEDENYNTLPETQEAIAQYLFLYQNSGDPQDLFRYISYDDKQANIWIQMKKGDNQDMTGLEKQVDNFIVHNPLPDGVQVNWAGLTYLNVVWQEKMVHGMLRSLMGSFAVVFLMMIFLFRSFKWGILSMIPLTFSILLIYGTIGLIGKNYDMPVAILSALTLGLSIDYAIHFIGRSRMLYTPEKGWRKTIYETFDEPAVAISRNAIVVALAFLPLLLAPLIPYKTVGVFLAVIIALSGIATLVLLPSIISVFGDNIYETKTKSIPLEEAFKIAIALLILISLVIGKFVTSYGYLLAALVCFGLIQSVFTGFCLIKILLQKVGLKD